MQTMNISLPDPLKKFVDAQIAQGRYSSVSEYVRELIRADEKRKAEEHLEALLLEGLQGEEAAFTRVDWQAIRRKLWRRWKRQERAVPDGAGLLTSRRPPCPELAGMRKWRINDFDNYLIFYLPRPDGVSIVRVLYSAQDWWSLLGIED